MYENIEIYDSYNSKWIDKQIGTLSTNSNFTGSGVFFVGIPLDELYIKNKKYINKKDYINFLESINIIKKRRVEVDMPNTIDVNNNQGIYVEISPDLTVYAVWYPKKECYVAIRKLTPKECFRLQGWTDDYFEKAQFVNSDSQLYKQAGNGVTVNVVYDIAKKLN